MMWWKRQPVDPGALAEGLILRTYKEGDAKGWIEVCSEDLGTGLWTEEDFVQKMLGVDGLYPEGIFLAVDKNGVIAGTATGVLKDKERANLGYVHMVCVRPAYRGMGLGGHLSAAVLKYLADNACTDVYLTTDDFRIPAIKTYLSLGFLPVIENDEIKARWTAIMKSIGKDRLDYLSSKGDFAGTLNA